MRPCARTSLRMVAGHPWPDKGVSLRSQNLHRAAAIHGRAGRRPQTPPPPPMPYSIPNNAARHAVRAPTCPAAIHGRSQPTRGLLGPLVSPPDPFTLPGPHVRRNQHPNASPISRSFVDTLSPSPLHAHASPSQTQEQEPRILRARPSMASNGSRAYRRPAPLFATYLMPMGAAQSRSRVAIIPAGGARPAQPDKVYPHPPPPPPPSPKKPGKGGAPHGP